MESDEKPKRVKVGFEVTEIMSNDIEKLYRELGYNDRAEFMRDAIREKIDRLKKESGTSAKRLPKEEKKKGD